MPYFFAQEDALADILVLWGQMDDAAKVELHLVAKSLAAT